LAHPWWEEGGEKRRKGFAGIHIGRGKAERMGAVFLYPRIFRTRPPPQKGGGFFFGGGKGTLFFRFPGRDPGEEWRIIVAIPPGHDEGRCPFFLYREGGERGRGRGKALPPSRAPKWQPSAPLSSHPVQKKEAASPFLTPEGRKKRKRKRPSSRYILRMDTGLPRGGYKVCNRRSRLLTPLGRGTEKVSVILVTCPKTE